MAATRLITHHISKGETIAQSMKDRFDYGQNPDKTLGGELTAAYMCDPLTADAEFLLSKAKYKAITGREQKKDHDVLCYQIRQSFAPGETDAETALKIGYDTAMRWTKGNYAFFVVSHTDRPHPHVHIYYNSTALHTKVHEAKIRSDSHKACQIFHSISTFSLVALMRTMSPSTT